MCWGVRKVNRDVGRGMGRVRGNVGYVKKCGGSVGECIG